MSQMQKRSLAMEFCRLCSAAEDTLDTCLALLRAGREYPALQIAESSSLMDSINELTFAELPAWRKYCADNDLPYPPPFDESRLMALNSLYTKGVSQNHPLYRDYRRAMRLRKYDEALSIIKTISKINSNDAEAREEYQRMQRLAAKRRVADLQEAMRDGDDEKFFKLIEFFDDYGEVAAKLPQWSAISAYKAERERARSQVACANILNELKELDGERDWKRVVELVADFNANSVGLRFDEAELENMHKIWERASEIQERGIRARLEAESRAMAREELDNPTKESPAQRLNRLLKLRQDCGEDVEEALKKRLDSQIFSLKTKVNFARFVRLAFALGSATVIAVVAFIGWSVFESFKEKSAAAERVAQIEKIYELSEAKNALAEFEKDFPKLAKSGALVDRISKVEADLRNRESVLNSIKSVFDTVTKADVSAMPASEVVSMYSDLDSALKRVSSLLEIDALTLGETPRQVEQKFRDKVLTKRETMSAETTKLLNELEDFTRAYALADSSSAELELEFEKLDAKLSPLITETSSLFKPHQIDLDKYVELTSKIKQIRAARQTYVALCEKLSKSSTLDEYFAIVDEICSMEKGVPQKYSLVFSSLKKGKPTLKNAFVFGVKNIEAATAKFADSSLALSKGDFTSDRLLTDVWRYKKTSALGIGSSDVYTRGKVAEQIKTWSGGSEVSQQADEISLGGVVARTLYRMQTVKDSSRGEILEMGMLTKESKMARNAKMLATEKSQLAALKFIMEADADPIFKIMLERALFEKLAEDSVSSGLAFSPSALARQRECIGASERFFPYSWLFENESKRNVVQTRYYQSKKVPDFEEEALQVRAAIEKVKKNPPKFVGVADATGKFDGKINGLSAIVVLEDGSLTRVKVDELSKVSLAPYSPIIEEKVSLSRMLEAFEVGK